MKNSLLIMNMILMIFITKSKADLFEQFQESYMPVHKHQNVKSFTESTSEKKFEETLIKITPDKMSIHNQELNLPQETNKETLDIKENLVDNKLSGRFTVKSINQKDVGEITGTFPPRSHLVDYYSELVNILGKKFEEVEVISKQNEIDIIEHTNGLVKDSGDQKKISDQKAKFLYAIYPYQPKSDESTSINGPITHVANEEEASSPFWYYQPTDRTQPHYSYLPTKKSQLFELFPSLESKSSGIYSSNKQMNAKKMYQHAKGTSSKISMERQNMAWPFGYDLNQTPVEYSLLHKIDMRPNSCVSQLFELFPGLELKSSGIYSSNKQMNAKKMYQHAKGTSSKISLERQNMAWPFGYDLTQTPVENSILHKIDMRPNSHVVEKEKKLEG